MRSTRSSSSFLAVFSLLAFVLLAGVGRADLLRVRASIDGRSRLVLQNASAYWWHFDFAAPGRLNCDTGTPIEPTYLGNLVWYPNWADTFGCENRDCSCTSDVAGGFVPGLPYSDFAVVLHVLQGRGTVTVVEQPGWSNGWRVGIEFDDDAEGGADWYEIDVETVPTGPRVGVSAQCDPFLAGQPAGTTSHADTAPAQSPQLVPLFLSCGSVRFTDVLGTTAYGPAHPYYGPEGGFSQASPSDLGIAGYTMPVCALLGVFLPDTTNSGLAPAALDFSTPASRDFARLEPQLFQPFFIGDGLRANGITPQDFVIPTGATRLFLGICDGGEWNNNLGSLTAVVEQRPCGTPPCFAWIPTDDFLLDADHQNPDTDRCSNPNVWHFLQSDPATYPARDPSGYTLLPTFDASLFGIDDLASWQGSETQPSGLPNLPWIAANLTGDDQTIGGMWFPMETMSVSPANGRYAIVGWRSPWTGIVGVSGQVEDRDASCGGSADGVAWFIDHFDGVANTNLASGVLADGGTQEFVDGTGGTNLGAIAVREGDFLYFVFDKGSSLDCDATGLYFVVYPSNNGTPFCSGDGLDTSHTTPCPCANEGAPGHGCENSVEPDGALLTATGNIASDDVVLVATGMPSTVACVFLQGDGLTDAVLNDGVRCVGGTLRRLRVRQNIQGTSTFPDAADVSTLSERGLVTVGSGAIRHYQVYYRNAAPSFCPSGVSNLTNGWTIVW